MTAWQKASRATAATRAWEMTDRTVRLEHVGMRRSGASCGQAASASRCFASPATAVSIEPVVPGEGAAADARDDGPNDGREDGRARPARAPPSLPEPRDSERVGAGHDGEAEGERDPEETDPELDLVLGQELRGEDGAATPGRHEPEGAEEFGPEPLGHRGAVHGTPWADGDLLLPALDHNAVTRP